MPANVKIGLENREETTTLCSSDCHLYFWLEKRKTHCVTEHNLNLILIDFNSMQHEIKSTELF